MTPDIALIKLARPVQMFNSTVRPICLASPGVLERPLCPDMSKDRGIYICQSQSLNLWMEDPEPKALTNMHFYSWKIGLKTGIYYLRRKAKHQAQQFTIEPTKEVKKDNEMGDCLMCGS